MGGESAAAGRRKSDTTGEIEYVGASGWVRGLIISMGDLGLGSRAPRRRGGAGGSPLRTSGGAGLTAWIGAGSPDRVDRRRGLGRLGRLAAADPLRSTPPVQVGMMARVRWTHKSETTGEIEYKWLGLGWRDGSGQVAGRLAPEMRSRACEIPISRIRGGRGRAGPVTRPAAPLVRFESSGRRRGWRWTG